MSLNEVVAELEEKTDWIAEAEAVMHDVRAHVTSISLSTLKLPCTSGVLLNISTIEGKDLCVLLGPAGYLVVGNTHDNKSLDNADHKFFESPYALLSSVSPSYVQSFGNLLIKKLNDQIKKDNEVESKVVCSRYFD